MGREQLPPPRKSDRLHEEAAEQMVLGPQEEGEGRSEDQETLLPRPAVRDHERGDWTGSDSQLQDHNMQPTYLPSH